EILQEMLAGIARRADAAASAPDGIAMIHEHDDAEPYDVVFMDWRMPGLDGLQAIRQLRADATLRHPPAMVLVTASGNEEVRAEAERLQPDGLLLKPITTSMVFDTLANLFGTGGDTAVPREPVAPEKPLRGARILLAEDNAINQQIATELLKEAG